MLEALFEIIGELVLQFIVEALAELGLHSLTEPFRKPGSPCVAALIYAIFGTVAGGLSLLVFPSHLVSSPELRMANLVITPVVVGLLMCAMGAWRSRRGESLLRIDRFSYGYLFALSLALIRFTSAQ
ncbi:MAG TPA: hypothetical protein VF585_06020 [Chthoniobacterales bacterium]|jgi:hypothetical protein